VRRDPLPSTSFVRSVPLGAPAIQGLPAAVVPGSTTGLQSPQISDGDDAVAIVLQAFGALMAALLWI
jgi:hypothetical protein